MNSSYMIMKKIYIIGYPKKNGILEFWVQIGKEKNLQDMKSKENYIFIIAITTIQAHLSEKN